MLGHAKSREHWEELVTAVVEKIMADLTKLNADIAALSTAVDAAVAKIKDLETQLAAANTDQTGVDSASATIEAKTAELTTATTA